MDPIRAAMLTAQRLARGGYAVKSRSGFDEGGEATGSVEPQENAPAPAPAQAADVTPQPANVPLPPQKPTYLQNFDYSKYDNPLEARYNFLSKSLNPTIAAAALGNFGIESWNNPNQFQTRTGTSSGDPLYDKNNMPLGYGSAQWGGTRLTNPANDPNKMGLFDFAKEYGFDPNSTEGQDRFMVYELTQNPEYAGAYKDMQAAGSDLNKVTSIFGSDYESPANLGKTLGDRQVTAQMFHDYFNNRGALDAADQAEVSRTIMGMMSDPMFQSYASNKNNATDFAAAKDTGFTGIQQAGLNTTNDFQAQQDAINSAQQAVNAAQQAAVDQAKNFDTGIVQNAATDFNYLNPLQNTGVGDFTNMYTNVDYSNPVQNTYTPSLTDYSYNAFDTSSPWSFAVGGAAPYVPPRKDSWTDRTNKELQKEVMSSDQEDETAEKLEGLQQKSKQDRRMFAHGGDPVKHALRLARGGYADGGDPPDEDVPHGESLLMRESVTPRNMAAQIQGPEATSGTASPDWSPLARDVGSKFTEYTMPRMEDYQRGAQGSSQLVQQGIENMKSGHPGMMLLGGAQDVLGTVMQPFDPIVGAIEAAKGSAGRTFGPAAAHAVDVLSNVNPDMLPLKAAHYAPELATAMMGARPAQKALEVARQPRELSPLGFYSHGAETAANLPQAKGAPDQMAAMLQKYGVKPDEMYATGFANESATAAARSKIEAEFAPRVAEAQRAMEGLEPGTPEFKAAERQFKNISSTMRSEMDRALVLGDEWSSRPSVTREELAAHFNERRPQIEETVLGTPKPEQMKILRDEYARAEYGEDFSGLASEYKRRIDDLIMDRRSTTKFQKYTLPGGENYREIALTLPGEEIYRAPAGHSMGDKADINRVAHLRMADRTGPNGEKILHVEEIQSDWGQKGKKEGFVTQYKPEDIKPIDPANITSERRRNEFWNFKTPTGSIDVPRNDRWPTMEAARQHILDNVKPTGIPTAPYVTNTTAWTDLALKRALKEAAEGGYDKLVWTPGAEQAKRYDLSKQISEVRYDPNEQTLFAYDKNGREVMNESGVEPHKIEDYIGREPAEKLRREVDNSTSALDEYEIARDPETREWGLYLYGEPAYDYGGEQLLFSSKSEARDHLRSMVDEEIKRNPPSIRGLDLETGGEGMKGYYDKIVPNQLSKLVKKLDPEAKIEKGRLPVQNYTISAPDIARELGMTVDEIAALPHAEKMDLISKVRHSISFPSLTITPKMREAIMKGQTDFARGGAIPFGPEAARSAVRIAKQQAGRR